MNNKEKLTNTKNTNEANSIKSIRAKYEEHILKILKALEYVTEEGEYVNDKNAVAGHFGDSPRSRLKPQSVYYNRTRGQNRADKIFAYNKAVYVIKKDSLLNGYLERYKINLVNTEHIPEDDDKKESIKDKLIRLKTEKLKTMKKLEKKLEMKLEKKLKGKTLPR